MIRIHLRSNAPKRVHLHVLTLITLFLVSTVSFASDTHLPSNIRVQVETIDQLIETEIIKANSNRNPLIPDNLFARRLYLDIAGRIPTYEELHQFMLNNDPNKRTKLIDQLLNSEAYVSHFYNYWADILRIKSKMRQLNMVAYQDWVKQSLRENMPYDEFVRQLVLASGYTWENPAAGYYLRDSGMPLDNMSNTVQVFLGTRMQCAQCHDHPFDKWTQKDYYHMAAYTSDLEAGSRRYQNLEAYQNLKQAFIKEVRQNAKKNKKGKIRFSASPSDRSALRNIFSPLTAKVSVEPKSQTLPYDYAYSDAEPNQIVAPKVPFGQTATLHANQDKRAIYASWLTSPDNPRFTTVIANRLWKKVMGLGLIEPSDNLTDHTKPSNPELMRYLSQLMTQSQYDTKHFLRVLFNTRTYQSEAYAKNVLSTYQYKFTGPILRRMSAEQLWDSILTLAVSDLDQQKDDVRTEYIRLHEKVAQIHVTNINKLSSQQMLYLFTKMRENAQLIVQKEKLIQKAITQTTSKKEKTKLKKQLRETKLEKDRLLTKLISQMVNDDSVYAYTNQIDQFKRKGKKAYQANFVRASEIISPAPAGHFLQDFGQSRRDLIEHSNQDASIPQALALLNGNLTHLIINKASPLSQSLLTAQKTSSKIDILFLSLYARLPSAAEKVMLENTFKAHKRYAAYQQIILAMLNTNEFKFIQ